MSPLADRAVDDPVVPGQLPDPPSKVVDGDIDGTRDGPLGELLGGPYVEELPTFLA